MNVLEDKKDEEVLIPVQRWLELTVVAAMLGLAGYLAYHQWTDTGFFTAAFGTFEMFCLYGPIGFGLSPSIVRALTGRRNPARPFDAATRLFLAAGSLWLLIKFPFDFSHLADILPGIIRFTIAWITNGIGKLMLIAQVLMGPISAFLILRKYRSIRQGEAKSDPQQAS